MRKISKLFGLRIVFFSLGFLAALAAYAGNPVPSETTVQMLPPTPPLNTNAKCNTGNPSQILAYSGNPNSAINCMPVQVDANGSLETLGSLTSDGATMLKQDLNVGANATINGTLTVVGNSLSLNSQTLTDTAVTQLNSLLSVINNCAATGGGVLTVSSAGVLSCTPSRP
jgi:hypothetical protein